MRHHIVTRIVVSLVVLWIAAVMVFAWAVRQPGGVPADPTVEGAGPTGEALFARHCAMCHEAADTGSAFREAPDRGAAAAALGEFLVGHYGPGPDGNARIARYLLGW
jgi:mono/diheme cytochrome c family protein